MRDFDEMKRSDLVVGQRRLKKLRRVFASAKKIQGGYTLKIAKNTVLFDIGDWASRLKEADRPLVNNKNLTPMYDEGCGTACCVAGTAGLIPDFRKRGLRTNLEGGRVTLGGVYGAHNDYAFQEFFKLTFGESQSVTMPGQYSPSDWRNVTPKMVVDKLDACISRRALRLRELRK